MAALLVVAVLSVQPAGAQDTTPGENLGGYDALSSAYAFSFQPFLPAFVSTGDVPFEGSFALTTSRVKSGGNAYARGSFLWLGSAIGDFGPIIGVAFGQPELGALIPKWPLQAEATQDSGEATTGVPPIAAMKATGHPDKAEGDARVADVNISRILHIEHIASTSGSVVTDTSVTSTGRVALHGISMLAGHITVEQVRSVSSTTSIGGAASSSGDVDVTGLKVGGVEVSVTDEGFQVEGFPESAEQFPGAGGKPVPGQSPEEFVNQVLGSVGARITLFKSISTTRGGQAERMQPGVIVSVDNPVGGQGPIPPGRFDMILGASSASAFGTLPFSLGDTSTDVLGGGATNDGGRSSGGGSISIGPGPKVDGGTISDVDDRLDVASGPGLLGTSPQDLGEATPQSDDYRFSGVPLGLVVGLLLLSGLLARYVRNFFNRMMSPASRSGGEG